MPTKPKSKSKNARPHLSRLIEKRPFLSHAALVFALIFAGGGGYFLHSYSNAATPELRADVGGGSHCVDDWNGVLGTTQPGGAARIALYECNGDSHQHFIAYGNQIRLSGTAQCLDAKGRGTANGTTIDLYPCVGGQTNQQWSFSSSGIIRGVGSNRCINVTGGSATDGNSLQLWDCHSDWASEHFTFTYYGTTSSGGGGVSCAGQDAAYNVNSAYSYAGECQSAIDWVTRDGYSGSAIAQQVRCASDIFNEESGWRKTAQNASGAYGIPQALPGSKMSSAGSNWASSADTQIKWGIGYMKGIYANGGKFSSPCSAWSYHQVHHFY